MVSIILSQQVNEIRWYKKTITFDNNLIIDVHDKV